MDNTARLMDVIQHFRNEAARAAWNARKLKWSTMATYYIGRYQALKHAAEYLAITVDYIDWKESQ